MISLCIIVEICDWLVGSVCFSLMFAHHLFFFPVLGGSTSTGTKVMLGST